MAISKKALIGGVSTAVVLAGGIGTYAFLSKSPKQEYLLAEYTTFDQTIGLFEERYANELQWAETTKQNATSSDYELSMSMDDYSYSLDPMALEIMNGTSAQIGIEADPTNATYAASFGATVLDYTIDDFTFYLTDESVLAKLPFQEEALELKLDGLANFSEVTTGDDLCLQNIDLSKYVKQGSSISEQDLNYLKTEYAMALYEALPEEAFTKDGDSLTMALTPAHLNQLTDELIAKAEKDTELHRILDEALLYSDPCLTLTSTDMIAELKTELENTPFEKGFTSTIVVDGNQIISRELANDYFVLSGTQSLDDGLLWDYEFQDQASASNKILFTGQFAAGKSGKDEVQIKMTEEFEFSYTSDESFASNTREFNRTFTFDDMIDQGAVQWEGTTTFDGDRVTGEHEVFVDVPEEGRLALIIKSESVKTKGMELPQERRDLTNMSQQELDDYLYNELAVNAEGWMTDIFNEFSEFLY